MSMIIPSILLSKLDRLNFHLREQRDNLVHMLQTEQEEIDDMGRENIVLGGVVARMHRTVANLHRTSRMILTRSPSVVRLEKNNSSASQLNKSRDSVVSRGEVARGRSKLDEILEKIRTKVMETGVDKINTAHNVEDGSKRNINWKEVLTPNRNDRSKSKQTSVTALLEKLKYKPTPVPLLILPSNGSALRRDDLNKVGSQVPQLSYKNIPSTEKDKFFTKLGHRTNLTTTNSNKIENIHIINTGIQPSNLPNPTQTSPRPNPTSTKPRSISPTFTSKLQSVNTIRKELLKDCTAPTQQPSQDAYIGSFGENVPRERRTLTGGFVLSTDKLPMPKVTSNKGSLSLLSRGDTPKGGV